MPDPEPIRLTRSDASSRTRLASIELAQVLRRAAAPVHPDLVHGSATGEEAAVWLLDRSRALVGSVDVCPPLLDDAREWGSVAAAASVSAVYAVGARPLFALSMAAWPRDGLPADLLGEALAAACDVAGAGGWLMVGGQVVDAPAPMLGLAVTAELELERMLTNDRGRPGDVLVLTKAVGTGIVTTALRRSQIGATDPMLIGPLAAALASMKRLNAHAAHVAVSAGLRCATDIDALGLAGRVHRLAERSGVGARLDRGHIPVLPGASDLAAAGFLHASMQRNADALGARLRVRHEGDEAHQIVTDPQTSGGLLLCVPPDRVDDVCAGLRAGGDLAAVVGELTDEAPGDVIVS